jgi:hypothetical protein
VSAGEFINEAAARRRAGAKGGGAAIVAPGVAGAAVFALLFVLRAVGTATTTSVTLAGRELHWGCAFRDAFGVPCPTCGMTRSVLLTLHGQLSDALTLNPGGPLLVAGGLLLGVALVALTSYRLASRASSGAVAGDALLRRFIHSASAYGGVTTLVVMAHWLRAVS